MIGIQKLAETGKIGIMKDFLEVRSPIQGGQLQFFCDNVEVDAQLKASECIRGLLQPNFAYFSLRIQGTSRNDAIEAIQCLDTVLSFP